MMTLQDLIKELNSLKNPQKAKILQRFFKTGKAEYGEGDIFLGITVPLQRQVARKFVDLNLADLQKLLNSKIHEYRLTALIILSLKYRKSDEEGKAGIVQFYLKNTKNINNWDLVDLSAPNILGSWLLDKGKKILFKLARSKNLWEKRIAIMSTFALIKEERVAETLEIAKILLKDEHDLIHKAVGWMLREVGKRNLRLEKEFLDNFHEKMPRVMLSYALEKFSRKEKEKYLKQKSRL